ncbi:DUF397 domain-containing protein [Kitasatospora terrestris]|uniref:DUF397 domain-containing protein n=1 Tax=Kitasatospora terrestris TaxID=258051 RepID=A0ABP9D6U3_9ACTN
MMYDGINLNELSYEKSRYSGNGGSCVIWSKALVESHGLMVVGDSKDPGGPKLVVPVAAWTGLWDAAAADEFSGA